MKILSGGGLAVGGFLAIACFVLLSIQYVFAGKGENGAGNSAVKEWTPEKIEERVQSGKGLADIPKEAWKQVLSEEQYRILWKAGTERPFSGELLKVKEPGVFVTAGCRIPVFKTAHKFESGTGWPSFWEALDKDNIILKADYKWGMKRTEVLSKCGEHLGHVFEDGPEPTGLRYCINSDALLFIPDDKSAPENP